MIRSSSSFESPMSYMFAVDVENSIVALERYVILAQTYLIFVEFTYVPL